MSKGVDLIIMDSDFKNFNIQCEIVFESLIFRG